MTSPEVGITHDQGVDGGAFDTSEDIRPVVDERVLTFPHQIADGVWWLRMDLGERVRHVNVYLLDDHDGWSIIDTGSNVESCRRALTDVLTSAPFASKPVRRAIITHHHPDHLGLAGWMASRGAEIAATATTWQSAQRILASRPEPTVEQIAFQQRGGLLPLEIEAYRRRHSHAYHDSVSTLPQQFTAVRDREVLEIGARKWTVHFGQGHASDHATFWSDDQIAIVGDQILPGISPNFCIHACESHADPVGGFLECSRKFAALATPATLCLAGHNTPFTGITRRCEQMIANQSSVLDRLLIRISRPQTAYECLESTYRRPIAFTERPLLVTQVVAYLDHLQRAGLAESEQVGTALLWKRK